MSEFHEVRFPENVSWGSSGGPIYKTHVFESFRGYEKRNIDWAQPLMQFNVAYGIKTDDQMMAFLHFFNARQGAAYGFRYKNWCGYRMVNRPIATGDGYSTRLPLWKFFGFNGARHYKRLRKIVRGSVTGVTGFGEELIEGKNFSIDYDSGEIMLPSAPNYAQPIYAQTLEFDEPVRFTSDDTQQIIEAYNTQSLNNLTLLSVRDSFKAGSIFAPGENNLSDPFYDQTRLILNMDDKEDPYTTKDQSQLALPVVLSGTAALTGAHFRHGGASLLLGPSGKCEITGSPFDMGEAAFTLEGFFTQPVDGEVVQPLIAKWERQTNRKSFVLRMNFVRKRLEFVVSSDGIAEENVLTYPWDAAANTFDHIALDRTENGWYVLRINGEVKLTRKYSTPIFPATTPLMIGGYISAESGEGAFQGYIDSVRITVGRNRYPGFEKGSIPTPYGTK